MRSEHPHLNPNPDETLPFIVRSDVCCPSPYVSLYGCNRREATARWQFAKVECHLLRLSNYRLVHGRACAAGGVGNSLASRIARAGSGDH
jgi:hypothetical protein